MAHQLAKAALFLDEDLAELECISAYIKHFANSNDVVLK